MTDEEKKARGLLYDTSKARAVREESSDSEDEGAADIEGGDPFAFMDDDAEEEEAVAEEKAPAAETKAAPDWNAEKIARKLAAMPDTGMTAEELAAQRAKARGGAMTDEEKKARGLLYDTSKARAVREESSSEEDDAAADF